MIKNKNVLLNLHKTYVKDSECKATVQDKVIFLCHLTFRVQKELKLCAKVYIKTRMIKHLYDKKPAQEYDFIIKNLHTMVKYPDKIYNNRDSKTGDYCFTKLMGGVNYLVSLEVEKQFDGLDDVLFIVTSFQLKKENYITKYDLLWSWKGGESSS